MATMETGELLYEYTVNMTGMTDYGISLESLTSGETPPPPEGARIDVTFEGPVDGPRLKGRISGIDYLHVRADGRYQLHLHACITTEDGHRIAFFADGVGLVREGSTIVDLRENVTLTTSSKEYAWVNPIQVWTTGTADLARGVVRLKGYRA